MQEKMAEKIHSSKTVINNHQHHGTERCPPLCTERASPADPVTMVTDLIVVGLLVVCVVGIGEVLDSAVFDVVAGAIFSVVLGVEFVGMVGPLTVGAAG